VFCNLLVFNDLQIWHKDCYAQIQMNYQPIKLQHYEQEIIFHGTACFCGGAGRKGADKQSVQGGYRYRRKWQQNHHCVLAGNIC
jgi:hypothetical protein